MLESLFFAVLGIAILMTILTVVDRHEIAWPILAIPSWLVCSVTVSNIDIPYAFLNDAGTVTEGVVTYHGGAFMQWFFAGFAIVFIIIFFNRVLEAYRETATGRRGRG